MIPGWNKIRGLTDTHTSAPPYFLKTEDLLVHKEGREIFIKRIFSTADNLPSYGPVVMSPGIACNANLFRIDDTGKCLSLDHNRSFANLLAAEGFDVYLFHPGYAERVFKRYVCRRCKDSIYYRKRFRVHSHYGYGNLINIEVPAVIDTVCAHSGTKNLSWIGYSLGGMIAYSHLSKTIASPIQNLVTIGSPMAFNQIFFRFIPYVNFASKILGLEEDALLGDISQNLVPLTRAIRALPDWFIRFNLISPYLFRPTNISNNTVRTMLGQIIEPMPKSLQQFFSDFIQKGGYSSQEKINNYLNRLRTLRKTKKNFLFFYGTGDLIATPESVFLAREVISPTDPHNLVASTAGHIDLIVGKNAVEHVWKPTLEWLKDKNS
jgi:pimeloyl-ACP methyl ester carboxylesterase